MEKYESIDSFSFYGPHIDLKENFEDRVKLLGSNTLNFCLRITTADLCKGDLKMRE